MSQRAEGVEEITKEAAIEALRGAALTHEPGESQLEDAIRAVRDLCDCQLDERGDVALDKLVPSSRILAALDEALAPRVTVHCLVDSPVAVLGADWDLDEAIALVGTAGGEGYLSGCAWTAGPSRHDLAIIAPNKLSGKLCVYRFDARKPASES
jgi:hypothetical protein